MAVKKFTPTQPQGKMLPQKLPPKTIHKTIETGRRDLQGITIDFMETPSIIKMNILDFIYLIYGPKKVGKTKFSSLFGADEGTTYFLMFEKLANHLSIRQTLMADHIDPKTKELVPAWLYAEAFLESLINDPRGIRTLCPDGMLAMYEKAFKQGCKEGGFKHPSGQNDYGLSWDKVKDTFYRYVDRLIESPFGLVFNCHDIALQQERFDGIRTQIVPNLPKYADEFVRHKIDNIFYMHIRGKGKRWLQLRGDENVYAACAPEKNFLTTNGEPVWMIPMGDSAEEGYKNFVKAFNNQQIKSYKEVIEEDLKELDKQRGDTTVRKTKEKKK